MLEKLGDECFIINTDRVDLNQVSGITVGQSDGRMAVQYVDIVWLVTFYI